MVLRISSGIVSHVLCMHEVWLCCIGHSFTVALIKVVVCTLSKILVLDFTAISYTCSNIIQYNTIRYDTIRYYTIRYDSIQYNTIRCDALRCDATRHDQTRRDARHRRSATQCNAINFTIKHDTMFKAKHREPQWIEVPPLNVQTYV